MSNKGQQNTVFEVLDTSLDLLGQRLVQNDNEKEVVATDFKEFRQQVYRKEVSPEELERVIAKVYEPQVRILK